MPTYYGSEAAWPHGKMVSLARKPPEPMPIDGPAPPRQPAVEYPYGCCLSFDDETLAALGLDGETPKPGDVLEFFAAAAVTCASQDPVTGKRRVELQIVEMLPHEEESAVQDAMEESAARRKRFYGQSMAEYDDTREAGPRP
jgi:hypothetical protein